MLEKVWSRNRMKQIINTGCKAFDRHVVCISSCAALGAAQFSGGVRNVNDPEDNEPGHGGPGSGQRYDLYTWFSDMPERVRKIVKRLADARPDGVMCHEFHHHYKARVRGTYGGWQREDRTIYHGYVIVREEKIIALIFTGPTHKSEGVIRTCAQYLGDTDENTEEIYLR